ncbi:hypothetical protein CRG98_031661 [Punica granatum]|uniref:Uncharacterized protein n=1 Tax=Punica granatum TaxID=22663 RepID=A0A2I0IV54_PUNGR|nr:hypothetical protein CRG98_031661 [Punica granatum]
MRKAGYKSNDYYLKQLIEEWCEGVIQDGNYLAINDGLSDILKILKSMRVAKVKPDVIAYTTAIKVCVESKRLKLAFSLFDEMKRCQVQPNLVAVNLQKSVAESLAVDLQGLTKVEARIVVLAVLRMIKENYIFGNSVQDDISIILGVSKPNANRNPEVKDAVIRLLQDELGLEVLVVGPKLERTPASSPIEMESSTRRPAILQRLKVRKKSLHQWLQRRAFAPRK